MLGYGRLDESSEGLLRVLLTANSASSMVWFRLPLLRELKARGHEVWVMAPEGWGVDQIHETGAHFIPMHMTQGFSAERQGRKGSYFNAWVDVQTARDVRRVCRVVRPELVLHYTHKMTVVGVPAARAAGVPRVHGMITGLGLPNLHGDLKQEAIRAAYRASIAVAGKVADSIILLNSDNMNDLVDGGVVASQKLFHLDGEGVDVARYAAEARRPEPGAPVFLMVARLVRYKGVREYVEAATAVKQRVPGARFLLAGGYDPQHPSAVPLADMERWRSEGNVEIIGHVTDIRETLRGCDVFVLPSYATEGLPMSIMEAMSASKPIITTDAPGNNETIEDGRNGILVPQKDVAALEAAMHRLATQPAQCEQMGRESAEIAARRFDHRVVNASLIAHLGL